MGIEEIQDIASLLDEMLYLSFGQRTAGNLLTSGGKVADPSQITVDKQTQIAKMVYLKNQQTWKTLLDFVNANLTPWIQSQSKVTTTYGKVVTNENEGKDGYTQTDKIAGFDSSEFSNDTANEHETTYGKKTTDTNTGTDTVTTESRSSQAERLVDYTVKFWIENGLANKLIDDAIKTISLPLYESED